MTNTRLVLSCVAVLCMAALAAHGQISQNHPELCGRPDQTVTLPANITAVSGNARSDVTITLEGKPHVISISGLAEVKQVCPLPENRIAIFASNRTPVHDVYIVQADTAKVIDEILGDEAAISPDQHWLVYREHHPPQSELSTSEEYLLYDLTKSPAENTYRPLDPNDITSLKGLVIYPVVTKQAPFFSYDLPKNIRHSFNSDSFFWASDSKSLVFSDYSGGSRKIVWVQIKGSGNTSASIHPVMNSAVCEEHTMLMSLILAQAEIRTTNDGTSEVALKFRPIPPSADCSREPLLLRWADFRPAPVEVIPPLPGTRKRSRGIRAK